MDALLNFAQNFGFPAAICAYLLYQQAQQEKFYQALMTQMQKSIDCLRDSVDDLADYIRGGTE